MKFKTFLTRFAQIFLPILAIAGLVHVAGPEGIILSVILGAIYLIAIVSYYCS